MHKPLVRFLFSFFMPLVLMGVVGSSASGCERPKRLVYSMVPEGSVEQDLTRFRPLLTELSESLGVPVDVVTPASYGAVIEALTSGAVHVARLGPAAYIAVKGRNSKITPFATFSQQASTFQEEGAFYYSMLVVLAKKPFRTYDDLRGKRLALVDPESTSGNKIPRLYFGRVLQGPLHTHFASISYAGSHQLAAEALLDGRVDAAFISSLHLLLG
ncbi:phosphate/phosphite/phosphonate ABC transporter substrate-binding protein [Noviherbaspirillum autotrophicum]|uniref:phosphate/phosphite/phosphonate ABC transporter substrate-binding protein n=1 Tax=Noviherbaspirillum autotrophicum TaxID=709839 RepID=UPI000693BEFE|nr:phosphate/phosphite/phosphonate ABC transporter substrate-binding protein [Noviherbaspirillum autotrophicum]